MKLILSFFITLSLSNAAFAKIKNQCKEQAKTFLKKEFGPNFEIIKMHSASGSSSEKRKEFWVRNNFCDGYIVIQTIPKPTCKVWHIGEIPKYVQRAWGSGECSDFLKQDIHITEDDI